MIILQYISEKIQNVINIIYDLLKKEKFDKYLISKNNCLPIWKDDLLNFLESDCVCSSYSEKERLLLFWANIQNCLICDLISKFIFNNFPREYDLKIIITFLEDDFSCKFELGELSKSGKSLNLFVKNRKNGI